MNNTWQVYKYSESIPKCKLCLIAEMEEEKIEQKRIKKRILDEVIPKLILNEFNDLFYH